MKEQSGPMARAARDGGTVSADATVRLTVGQAVVRFLAAPRTERFWDLGVPMAAVEPAVAALAAPHVERAERQRPYV